MCRRACLSAVDHAPRWLQNLAELHVPPCKCVSRQRTVVLGGCNSCSSIDRHSILHLARETTSPASPSGLRPSGALSHSRPALQKIYNPPCRAGLRGFRGRPFPDPTRLRVWARPSRWPQVDVFAIKGIKAGADAIYFFILWLRA